ncbi:LytTR family DNA-binding domain-containing protein [Eubacteriaceae bacterium ES2]|nr:LytTR family DNA-binding domain-containing protein [Eubacteriaceae bacterium ES2]
MIVRQKQNPDKELTVTIEYPKFNDQVSRIINKLKAEKKYLIGTINGQNYKVLIPAIHYVECVDKKSFIYTKNTVYCSELRLFQLEKNLEKYDFVKVNRNCLLNINELLHIETLANSRLEAELTNGEKIVVSRTYIATIKRMVFKEGRN